MYRMQQPTKQEVQTFRRLMAIKKSDDTKGLYFDWETLSSITESDPTMVSLTIERLIELCTIIN